MLLKFTKTTAHFDRWVDKIARLSIPYLILFSVLTDIFITCIFSLLFPDHTAGPDVKATVGDFILVVIVAPVVETWIIQSWLIKKILTYSNNNKLAAVLFSAIVFGLAHHYSIPYILKATLAGGIYGLLYVSISAKQKNPFYYIVLTHGIYNLIGFIINIFIV